MWRYFELLSFRPLGDIAALRAAVARQRLSVQVNNVLAGPDVSSASAKSCAVVRVAGGIVTANGGRREVIPASTLKVLTAIGVLARVDATERFVTTVRATARPVGGILTGDLWLVGGGDPLLETASYTTTQNHGASVATSLETLADNVVAAGISQISGRIIGDDRRYDSIRVVSTWKRSYVSSGEVGPTGGLMIDDNFTRLNAKGIRTAAVDVGADAASAFQRALMERGITVVGVPSSVVDATADAATVAPVSIAEIRSAPLGDIIGEMLRWSDNTTAEMLVKELGFRTAGKGTTADGIAAIRAALVLRIFEKPFPIRVFRCHPWRQNEIETHGDRNKFSSQPSTPNGERFRGVQNANSVHEPSRTARVQRSKTRIVASRNSLPGRKVAAWSSEMADFTG